MKFLDIRFDTEEEIKMTVDIGAQAIGHRGVSNTGSWDQEIKGASEAIGNLSKET